MVGSPDQWRVAHARTLRGGGCWYRYRGQQAGSGLQTGAFGKHHGGDRTHQALGKTRNEGKRAAPPASVARRQRGYRSGGKTYVAGGIAAGVLGACPIQPSRQAAPIWPGGSGFAFQGVARGAGIPSR